MIKYYQETSRNVITTIRNRFQVYMGNKGKTPIKSLFEMFSSQKNSCILQHYKEMSFVFPQKTGNC